MSNYATPGVYIKEISTLPASIAAVETAIPAFIGHTDLATKNGEPIRGVPTRITSMLEYESIFGFAQPELITVAIQDAYIGENNQPAKLSARTIKAIPPATTSRFKMYYSLRLFFLTMEEGPATSFLSMISIRLPLWATAQHLPACWEDWQL
ncbi:hypothetical protein [Algoriphagus boritolerans]|uniref:hypothetical protein n=1 Tax=Algoriphagus boritolerans TaxID=308111 RepID=UPI000A992061